MNLRFRGLSGGLHQQQYQYQYDVCMYVLTVLPSVSGKYADMTMIVAGWEAATLTLYGTLSATAQWWRGFRGTNLFL
jgi:hypothetical protein